MMACVPGGQQAHDPARYALFAFVGFSVWQAWIETLRAQLGALRRYKSLVGRGDMGSGTIALSGAMTALIQLAPRLLLALVLALATQHPVTLFSLGMLLLGGILVVTNATAFGTLLQPWATLTPAVDRVVQSVTLALIFTGGVFLPLPADPPPLVAWLLALNPFGALLEHGPRAFARRRAAQPDWRWHDRDHHLRLFAARHLGPAPVCRSWSSGWQLIWPTCCSAPNGLGKNTRAACAARWRTARVICWRHSCVVHRPLRCATASSGRCAGSTRIASRRMPAGLV